MSEKRCSHCHEWKPRSEYYKDAARKDGLNHRCKACIAKYHKNKWATDEEYRADKKARLRQWYDENSDRRRAYEQEYIQAHRERVNERRRRWREKNLHSRREYTRHATSGWKARQAGCEGTYTVAEWQALCDHYGNRCLACGIAAHETREGILQVDHVVPYSKQGRNDLTNLQPLCAWCNLSKHANIIDYRPDRGEWATLYLEQNT